MAAWRQIGGRLAQPRATAAPRPQVRDLLAAAQPGAMLHAFAQGILEWNQEFRVPFQVAIDLRQLLKGLPATGDVLIDRVD